MPPQPPPSDTSTSTQDTATNGTTTTSTPKPKDGTSSTNLNSMDQYISLSASHAYWSSIPPTTDGMLGGYESVTTPDLKQSKRFISQVRRILAPQSQSSNTSKSTATKIFRTVDCGAGIGRITKGLLLKIADTVDVVEPIPKFADEVRKLKGEMDGGGGIGDIFVEGLESWTPPHGRKYGLIWNQWCLGHLTDGQLVGYLGRIKGCLTEPKSKSESSQNDNERNADTDMDTNTNNTSQHEDSTSEEKGWIMVKENLSKEKDGDIFDEQDSSVTRTDKNFRRIFAEAGLTVVKSARQEGFPSELYVVMMYALRPS